MAQLKDLVVNGDTALLGTTFTYDVDSTNGTVKLNKINTVDDNGAYTANPSTISDSLAIVNDGNGGVKWGTVGRLNDLGYVNWRSHFKSINHRGWRNKPSETLEAYKESAIHGFKYVECDIRKTADGVFILCHDEDLINATLSNSSSIATNYNYKYTDTDKNTYEAFVRSLKWNSNTTLSSTTSSSSKTYGALKNLRISYYPASCADYDPGPTTSAGCYKLATLDSFIKFCKHYEIHPYLEIKRVVAGDTSKTSHEGEFFNLEEITAIFNIVKSYDMLDHVTWISFDISALEKINSLDTTSRLGYVCELLTSEPLSDKEKRVSRYYQDEVDTLISVRPSKYNLFVCGSFNNLLSGGDELLIKNKLDYISDARLPLEVWISENGFNRYVEKERIDNFLALPNKEYITGFMLDFYDMMEVVSNSQPTANARSLSSYMHDVNKYDQPIDTTNCLTYKGAKLNSILGNPSSDLYSCLVTVGGNESITGNSTAVSSELVYYQNGIANWDFAFNNTGIYTRKVTITKNLTDSNGNGTTTSIIGNWAELITSENYRNYVPDHMNGTLEINGTPYNGSVNKTLTIGSGTQTKITLFDINDYPHNSSTKGDDYFINHYESLSSGSSYTNTYGVGAFCNGSDLSYASNGSGINLRYSKTWSSQSIGHKLVPINVLNGSSSSTSYWDYASNIVNNYGDGTLYNVTNSYQSPNSILLWQTAYSDDVAGNTPPSSGIWNHNTGGRSFLLDFRNGNIVDNTAESNPNVYNFTRDEWKFLMEEEFPFKALEISARFPYATCTITQDIIRNDASVPRALGNYQCSLFTLAGDSQNYGSLKGYIYYISWRLIPIFRRTIQGGWGNLRVFLQVVDSGWMLPGIGSGSTDSPVRNDMSFSKSDYEANLSSSNAAVFNSSSTFKFGQRHNVGYSIYKVVGIPK